jgi:uncharacterized membrane protein YeaQ/YmgE (transglycosylase-associated protein family)
MEGYGFMGVPGLGLIGFLIVGLLAGWIAEKITKSDHGLLTNLVVGVIGAYIGGFIAGGLGMMVFGFIGNLIAAIVGAVILIYVWRAIRQRSN